VAIADTEIDDGADLHLTCADCSSPFSTCSLRSSSRRWLSPRRG
jgi:hypothetical protein